MDGRSASGVASSAEKHAGDALAVLHIKGCESGEFRSSEHLAYELARRVVNDSREPCPADSAILSYWMVVLNTQKLKL